MFDGRGLVDESYKDGSGSKHRIYQTYKVALYLYTPQTTGPEDSAKRFRLITAGQIMIQSGLRVSLSNASVDINGGVIVVCPLLLEKLQPERS